MLYAPAGPAVRFVPLVALALTVTIALTLILGPAHRLGRSAAPIREAHARVDQPSDPCPATSPPGTIVWTFLPPRSGPPADPIIGIPAVADDGTAYVTTVSGRLYAVDCMGNQRWMRDQADNRLDGFSDPPAIGDDGSIYANGGINTSAFVAVNPDGSTRWTFTIDRAQKFNAAPAFDRHGRSFASAGRISGQSSFVYVLGPEGTLLPGFPLLLQPIDTSPVVLADERLVTVSRTVVKGVTPTSPPPTPPPLPPTPWADARATLHLPLLLAEQSVAAREPRDRVIEPSPIFVTHPAQLTIVTAGASPSQSSTFDIGDRNPESDMAALGTTVVLQVRDGAPRLVALALDSDPPHVLWEHVLHSRIATAPILGRIDAETGMVELVYLDEGGTLVSLAVPVTPDSATPPRFNWAVTLSAGATVAPVLGDAGLVYVATGSTVAAFSRLDGSKAWSMELFGVDSVTSSLTIGSGGLLLVGTQLGRLVAISTESRGLDPEAAWPAARHDARNTGRADR